MDAVPKDLDRDPSSLNPTRVGPSLVAPTLGIVDNEGPVAVGNMSSPAAMSPNPNASKIASKTRRTHTKSRGGCMECKRRKLKCDERKPVCGGCTKRELAHKCVFSKSSSRKPLSKELDGPLRPIATEPKFEPGNDVLVQYVAAPATGSPHPVIVDDGLASTSRGIGQFNMEDMTLWHQFICITTRTLATPWGTDLPSLALECDYLLHGILALGALHLAYTNHSKQEHYNYLASHHYDLAIRPFQRAMTHVGPSNANQLFAFSTLLMVSNYASNRSPGFTFPFSNAEAYDGVIPNWISCLRGCITIFELAKQHIEAGPFGYLVKIGTELQKGLSTGAQLFPEDDRSLNQVVEVVLELSSVKASMTAQDHEAYLDAIGRLRPLLAASTQQLDSVIRRAIANIWPSKVSDTFVCLLKQNRPPALVIMAHYCLLLRGLEGIWYMEHRGLNLFQTIERSLGDEWAIYIEHPRREMTRKSSFDGVAGSGGVVGR